MAAPAAPRTPAAGASAFYPDSKVLSNLRPSLRAPSRGKRRARVTSGRVRMGEGGEAAAVFHVTDGEGRLPPGFGDYPYGGPTEWAGPLPRAGTYRIVVFVEDGPDDPDEATLRRMRLSLRYGLKVTLR